MAVVDRQKIQQNTLDEIKRQIPGIVLDKYKNYNGSLDVECISTGSLSLDNILGYGCTGVGGAAKGRILNLFGHTSSGKTTVALTIIATEQKKNPEANILYVDAENALDPKYAKTLGVNLDEVYLIQPDTGEEGYKAAEMMVDSGVLDILVIDSIAALVPKAILETELGDQAPIGAGARLDIQGIGRIFAKANKCKTVVIVINQLVEDVKIDRFARGDKVSGKMKQPGSEYLKFYYTHMLELDRVDQLMEGDVIVSNVIRGYTRKNKIAPPYRTGDFYITFGVGLDLAQEAIDLGIITGDIELIGRTYTIVGESTGYAGRPKFAAYLNENSDVLEGLREKITKSLRNVNTDIIIEPIKEPLE